MKGCITVLRVILSIFISVLLFIVISAGLPAAAVSSQLTNREALKSMIHRAQICENFTDTAVDLMGQSAGLPEPLSNFPDLYQDENSDFNDVINDAITPQHLCGSIDGIIDGVFDWLDGKTETPNFEIELFEKEESFEAIFSVILEEEFESLPKCEPGWEPDENTDMSNLECLPEEFDTQDIDSMLENSSDQSGNEAIPTNFSFSSADLEITPETTDQARSYYAIAQNLTLIVAAAAAALTLLLVLMVPGFDNGSIAAGALITVAGAISVLPLILSKTVFDIIRDQLAAQTTNMEISFIDNENIIFALQSVFSDLTKSMGWYGMITIIAGIGLITIGIVIKILKREEPHPKENPKDDPEDEVVK